MPYAFTTESVEYIRHGDTPYMVETLQAQWRWAVPDGDRFAWWRLVQWRSRRLRSRAIRCWRRAVWSSRPPISATGPMAIRHRCRISTICIRCMKANAAKLNGNAKAVGLSGTSSGGHLAMLSAMRPNDPRYAAVDGPAGVDATVQAIVMQWPVINPISRYRHARRLLDGANPPAWPKGVPDRHETYWKTEAAMIEGNPITILEKGEKVRDAADVVDPGPAGSDARLSRSGIAGGVERAAAVLVRLPQGGRVTSRRCMSMMQRSAATFALTRRRRSSIGS